MGLSSMMRRPCSHLPGWGASGRCLLQVAWKVHIANWGGTRQAHEGDAVQATPTADTAMFFFETNKLGFTAEFLGRVRLAGALASLGGVATYNALLKQVPLRKMFLWTACIGTALGLTQLLLITGAAQTTWQHLKYHHHS